MKTTLDSQLQSIPVPPSLHARCAAGARLASQARRRARLKRLTAAAAAVCVLTLSHPSVADSLRGFFSDIVRSDGAVTGTAYTPGEGELLLSVPDGSSLQISLPLLAQTPSGETELLAAGTHTLPYTKSMHSTAGTHVLPFCEIERFAVGARILGADGSETAFSGEADVLGSTAEFSLPKLPAGEYTLKIESLSGLSKADSPLEIRGEWEISFTAGAENES